MQIQTRVRPQTYKNVVCGCLLIYNLSTYGFPHETRLIEEERTRVLLDYLRSTAG